MKNSIITAALILASIVANGQTWQPNPKYIKHDTAKTAGSAKKQFQCYGTTQKGERCKRKTEADRSYCYQHQNQK